MSERKSGVASLPVWGCWVSGVALLLVALAAGGLSLAINVIAGLSVGVPIAVMFGLSDVGKVLIPIVCQAIGWNTQLVWVYRAAAIVSIACAILTTADMFGTKLAALDVDAQKVVTAKKVYSDLKAKADELRRMADDEAKRGGCGPNCKDLLKKAEAIDTEVAQAAGAVKKQQDESGVTITGLGFLTKNFFQIDPDKTNVVVIVIKVAMGITIMELMCSLVGFAASMIGIAMSRSKKTPQKKSAPRTTTKKKAAPKKNPEPVKVEEKKPTRKWTAAQTVAYLDRTLNKEKENA